MILQISSRVAIHGVEPKQRNRVNTAFVSMLYVGMLAGAKAGNEVYEKNGGWVASGCLSIGVIVIGLLAIVARGPHEKGWVGWHGGWGRVIGETMEEDEEVAQEKKVSNKELKEEVAAVAETEVEIRQKD